LSTVTGTQPPASRPRSSGAGQDTLGRAVLEGLEGLRPVEQAQAGFLDAIAGKSSGAGRPPAKEICRAADDFEDVAMASRR